MGERYPFGIRPELLCGTGAEACVREGCGGRRMMMMMAFACSDRLAAASWNGEQHMGLVDREGTVLDVDMTSILDECLAVRLMGTGNVWIWLVLP